MFKTLKDAAVSMRDGHVEKEIGKLCKHIEDIAEAQDEMTKALLSIYQNQIAMAAHFKITLPEPLIKMTIEEATK